MPDTVIPITTVQVGHVVGPAGATIKGIQESTGATVEIVDGPAVKITAEDDASVRAAEAEVRKIVDEQEHPDYEGAEGAKLRQEANALGDKRSKLFDEATALRAAGNQSGANELVAEGKAAGEAMQAKNREAAAAIARHNNEDKGMGENYFDMHGLREEEAMEMLRQRVAVLRAKPNGTVTEMEIIAGAGHHSAPGAQKLRGATAAYLQEEGLKSEENPTGTFHVPVPGTGAAAPAEAPVAPSTNAADDAPVDPPQDTSANAIQEEESAAPTGTDEVPAVDEETPEEPAAPTEEPAAEADATPEVEAPVHSDAVPAEDAETPTEGAAPTNATEEPETETEAAPEPAEEGEPAQEPQAEEPTDADAPVPQTNATEEPEAETEAAPEPAEEGEPAQEPQAEEPTDADAPVPQTNATEQPVDTEASEPPSDPMALTQSPKEPTATDFPQAAAAADEPAVPEAPTAEPCAATAPQPSLLPATSAAAPATAPMATAAAVAAPPLASLEAAALSQRSPSPQNPSPSRRSASPTINMSVRTSPSPSPKARGAASSQRHAYTNGAKVFKSMPEEVRRRCGERAKPTQ